ncbi:HNH endonuclease [Paenibacillus macerans]|uniref:HNH endonuclease n=1 Tax=Paenibacillus macerans TaxID=44252 RepID=UPI000EF022E4|nr:HNH endonuclease [Paenibacillus macerans]GBK65493.1 HNH endonuclease [Paenibacillus macerans]GBK71791.1 HNH endonuclease [Paenibacillus macerans]
MKNVKHTKIGYHDATILAGRIISEFYGDSATDYDYMNDFIEDNFDEIIVKFVNPQKFTVLHMLIKYFDDLIYGDGIREILKNVDWDDYEMFLEYMSNMISNTGIDIGIRFPDFKIIDEAEVLDECDEFNYVDYYINTLEVKRIEAQPLLINSTFHVLMINKIFLRDLNEFFATYIQKHIDRVPLEYLDKDRKLLRTSYWNSWLKRGIFFRDKGVCTLCRKDLTGSYNLGINFEIDHIVPLSKYGNNDPVPLSIE